MSEPNRLLGLMNQQPTMSSMLRQPEVRPYEYPWYQAIPHAVADWWYGGQQTAPQQQWVNNLLGTSNPINIPGQAQEAGHTLGTGIKVGSPEMAGIGLLGAGLAVMGMPRGRGPIKGYRGSAYGGSPEAHNPTYWASTNPDTAADYAMHSHGARGPSVTPAEFRFLNPLEIDGRGANWQRVPYGDEFMTTDNVARIARRAGHDGLVVRNVIDPAGGSASGPQDTIAALRRGTVYSPQTGELLFSGALGALGVGAASSAFSDPAAAAPANGLLRYAP